MSRAYIGSSLSMKGCWMEEQVAFLPSSNKQLQQLSEPADTSSRTLITTTNRTHDILNSIITYGVCNTI